MHPLVGSLSDLKTSEIENKINELSKKYFMVNSFELQQQVSLLLETYKGELSLRRYQEWERMSESRNKDLDKLINVN